ncbi:sulfatase [Flagellimonas myxillae]|uniref:sulfatase n=1 Tax=Flagellimonas myxillae TaxID=2942214 RepID=UPI00201F693F|nr:sulfatase [Muricauda myxillae]MCL6265340.1 sulfatase [Muricauda myxillae]
MKTIKILVYSLLCASIVVSCSSPKPDKRPNILLLCVDDLRPELNSFGASHIKSPNIDQLASQGVSFYNHYVNAPSCGPSRYTLLTGQYGGANNDALFKRAEAIGEGGKTANPSMPEWFKTHGYTTVSVGKVSHHPGGRGGSDWNDSTLVEMPNAWDKHLMPVAEWMHPRGAMHGLAHGEIRVKAEDMDVFQSAEGTDNNYPDGIIAEEAITQLRTLSEQDEKPFFLAVGFIKPHLPFGAPKPYLDTYDGVEIPIPEHRQKPETKTTWHPSGEFMKYNRWGKDPNNDPDFADEVRRHYAACVSYVDQQVGRVMAELKRSGADKNTIVILWGDHGWHLGEHAIWGKHSLFEESLQSPLIIHHPGMESTHTRTKAIVETVDIFPTLCDLSGIEKPKFVHGESLMPILSNQELKGNPAFAYTNGAITVRTQTHRLTLHKDGFTELYDHTSPEGESKNVAEVDFAMVQELKEVLKDKLPDKYRTLLDTQP